MFGPEYELKSKSKNYIFFKSFFINTGYTSITIYSTKDIFKDEFNRFTLEFLNNSYSVDTLNLYISTLKLQFIIFLIIIILISAIFYILIKVYSIVEDSSPIDRSYNFLFLMLHLILLYIITKYIPYIFATIYGLDIYSLYYDITVDLFFFLKY